MLKNTANQILPDYFVPARGTIMDYYRLIANSHKWKNYLVITYTDKYEGYESTFKFRAALK